MSEPGPLVLEDLILPLTRQSFIDQYWALQRPYLSEASQGLIGALRGVSRLASVESYLSGLSGDVWVFGPNAFRSEVPARAALDFLANGYNLYFVLVERTIPRARDLFLTVARDLGIAPWQIGLEAFAGRPGGVSSRHFDHDVNFQILLDGEKEWQLAENVNIRNPLLSYHPTRDPGGRPLGFKEELYAADPAMPRAFDRGHTERVRATAGSVLFLPRGYWHETHSLSSTWGVNLIVRGVTYAAAMATALHNRLLHEPDFRAYCESMAYAGAELTERERARASELFERLRRAAIEAIVDLDPMEASLASVKDWYEWSWKADKRAIVEDDGVWFLHGFDGLEPLELDPDLVPVLKELVALTGPFSWSQMQRVSRKIGAVALYNLLNELTEMELLVRRA